MAAERECGDTVSVFTEDEDMEDGVNIWGKIIGEKVRSLENSCEKCPCGAVESTHREPVNHREMMKRPEEERIKWQEGMQKEFKDFEKRGVWKVMKTRDMPSGRKLIGCKWVYKLKRNGVCRSCPVALDTHKHLEWTVKTISQEQFMM